MNKTECPTFGSGHRHHPPQIRECYTDMTSSEVTRHSIPAHPRTFAPVSDIEISTYRDWQPPKI